jgi:hypothetical protein
LREERNSGGIVAVILLSVKVLLGRDFVVLDR